MILALLCVVAQAGLAPSRDEPRDKYDDYALIHEPGAGPDVLVMLSKNNIALFRNGSTATIPLKQYPRVARLVNESRYWGSSFAGGRIILWFQPESRPYELGVLCFEDFDARTIQEMLVALPPETIYFAFLDAAGRKGVNLASLTSKSFLTSRMTNEASIAWTEELVRPDRPLCEVSLHDRPEQLKWRMDVDRNGWRDLLVPNGHQLNFLLMDESGVSRETQLRLDEPFVSYMLASSGQSPSPDSYELSSEIWVEEPPTDELPDLCIRTPGDNTLRLYHQTEPGLFQLRGTTDTLIYSSTSVGALAPGQRKGPISVKVWREGVKRFDCRLAWRESAGSIRETSILGSSLLAPIPVDPDHDGVTELLVFDSPLEVKLLGPLAWGNLKNLRSTMRLLRYSETHNLWQECSYPSRERISPSPLIADAPKRFMFPMEALHRKLFLSGDFDRNGILDIAWLDDYAVNTYCLCKNGRRICFDVFSRFAWDNSEGKACLLFPYSQDQLAVVRVIEDTPGNALLSSPGAPDRRKYSLLILRPVSGIERKRDRPARSSAQ